MWGGVGLGGVGWGRGCGVWGGVGLGGGWPGYGVGVGIWPMGVGIVQFEEEEEWCYENKVRGGGDSTPPHPSPTPGTIQKAD